jgi:hypothetical protein
MARRRGTAVLAALATLALVALAGCGRDDFENDPRPPVPLEISVKISDSAVRVSPAAFGAGLVNFTIANLSEEAAALVLEGPTLAESDQIPPNGSALLKAEMETGRYQASADGPSGVIPFEIAVGPERPSGKDDLLLP